MKTISSVETHLYGHRFRSRLEARWAVFFTTLGVRWQYEPRNVSLGTPYYPDFFVDAGLRLWSEHLKVLVTHEPGRGIYVEIKPFGGAFDQVERMAAHRSDLFIVKAAGLPSAKCQANFLRKAHGKFSFDGKLWVDLFPHGIDTDLLDPSGTEAAVDEAVNFVFNDPRDRAYVGPHNWTADWHMRAPPGTKR